ncbi:uncharacterized protein LOC124359999 isoform X2 [Homalodisca vitripennis]|uniref:uncharacterized protein LOC124359999 isoform X2 n=1 Tax=Homalodisca vitripennis TaxID=197043 RepID=UPI001EECDE16|nr:uncharacterized protein LOC124359999 isoform X2 [Homalodisca vitripennis]
MGRVHILVLAAVVSILTTGTTAYLPEVSALEYGNISSTPAPVYCDRQYSCLDCSTSRVCAPTDDGTRLYEVDRVTCPTTAPVCDYATGTCTDSSYATCHIPPTEANNICMRDGIFPDPKNCSRYFTCKGDQATTYSCPLSQPYYSFLFGYCYSYSGYCLNGTNRCQGKSGAKVSAGWNSNGYYNYFLYCENNATVAVDRCIGANYFYDYYQRCVPSCPFVGLYPSQDSCTEYYKCTSNNPQCYSCDSYTMTNMTCPPGQGFSETEFQCIDRSLVPNCNVPNSDFFNKR